MNNEPAFPTFVQYDNKAMNDPEQPQWFNDMMERLFSTTTLPETPEARSAVISNGAWVCQSCDGEGVCYGRAINPLWINIQSADPHPKAPLFIMKSATCRTCNGTGRAPMKPAAPEQTPNPESSAFQQPLLPVGTQYATGVTGDIPVMVNPPDMRDESHPGVGSASLAPARSHHRCPLIGLAMDGLDESQRGVGGVIDKSEERVLRVFDCPDYRIMT